MNILIWIGRIFYGLYIACLGIQQFIYKDFRIVLIPGQWPAWLHSNPIGAYITGAGLVVAAIFILFTDNARTIALILGWFFLVLFVCFHIPYQLFYIPYKFHFANWTDALEELSLSGGAFILAGSYRLNDKMEHPYKPQQWHEMAVPYGRILFAIMFIVFGIDHFAYGTFMTNMVPIYIPGKLFWIYFAGAALIGSGICLLFNIQIRLVAALLATMLFLWVLMIHLPNAIIDPYSNNGNKVTSLFDALGFCGIAMLISIHSKRQIQKESKLAHP